MHGLTGSIFWKWLYYQKQCTFSVNSPSKYSWHSLQRLKNQPIVHLEAQKTSNNQSNAEQKEQHDSYHNTWFQTILQSYSNKNSTVLTQKQIWRPVEQNKSPGFESIELHPSDFWQRQPNRIKKNTVFQQMLLGKLDICMQKTETRSISSIPCKYQLKVG
jgi:hypothetical protein